ncbi:Protein ILITYHIA [Glycine max]|nr:Protein ILITYHIA [Glycine max]
MESKNGILELGYVVREFCKQGIKPGELAIISKEVVGSVIKSPEISGLVPTLLKGLCHPKEHTKYSLNILLQVRLLILFSVVVSLAKQWAFEEPSVETITGENVLT